MAYDYNLGCVTVSLIGIFGENNLEDYDDELFQNFVIDKVVLEDDYNNGVINGCKAFGGNILCNYYDTSDFIIRAKYYYDLDDPEYAVKHDYLLQKDYDILNNLESGEVVTFEADLQITSSTNYNDNEANTTYHFTVEEVRNVQIYNDKYASDEIKLLVSEIP